MVADKIQKKAIEYGLSNLLVIAGPGSGKTFVLTERIKYLTNVKGINENEILVLTFTKAASEEMKSRYLNKVCKINTSVTFGTFHSVFLSVLKKQNKGSEFSIISHELETEILNSVYKNKEPDKMLSNEQTEKLLDDFSRIKSGLSPRSEETVLIYNKYVNACRERGLMDFDDILIHFFNLLINAPELLNQLRNRYHYVLIDEFQDINRIQYEIIKLLCGNSNRIFAVGDDDQSIYGFRGSDPEYMKNIRKDFKNCGRIILNRNYRSTGAIVSYSQRLISKNSKRIKKYFKPVRQNGLKPFIYGFINLKEEAEYIEKRIGILEKCAEKENLIQPTFAVLARTNNALEEIKSFISYEISRKIEFRTFHSSKGLEFDAVFITHANNDITPGRNIQDRNTLEEERRTFYVAMTRCRSYLHIFYTCGQYNNRKSMFIDD